MNVDWALSLVIKERTDIMASQNANPDYFIDDPAHVLAAEVVRLRSIIESKCKKCGGEMKPGKAIEQTYTGVPDFSCGEVVTMSLGGKGRLIDCLKCSLCGYSATK